MIIPEPVFNIKDIKIKHIILTLFIIIFTFIASSFVSWIRIAQEDQTGKVYFNETFDNGSKSWEVKDCEIITDASANTDNKILKLSSKEYLAPFAMHKTAQYEAPPDTFVFHFKVLVSSFTDNSVTLASLHYSTQPIAVVADQEGRLGIAHQIFSLPEYSESTRYRLKKDKWQDIYLAFDNEKHTIDLYLEKVKILSKPYNDITYPLQEIWIGTIWVKGGGNYGVPIDIRYDDIVMGDKGLIPKPSFIEYLYSLL